MEQAWKKLEAITGRVNEYLAFGAGIAICGMFAVTTYEVVMRYFFLRPTRWSVDVGEMLMLPAAYLAAALLLREGGHIRIDLLIGHIHGQPRKVMELGAYLVGLVWGLLVVLAGSMVFADFMEEGKLSQIAELPLFPAIFFIPVGGAFLVLEFFIRIVDEVLGLKGRREKL